jgi:signal transduction histidine kinase
LRKVVIVALTIGVLLVLLALRVADFVSLREETLVHAEARAGNLALILSEYIAEAFDAGDAALRQLQLHSRRIGGPDAAAAEWTPSLSSALAGLASIGSISVVDAEGTIRHSTLPDIVGQSRATVPPFTEAVRTATDDLFVGAPFRSPVLPNVVVIPIARRLTRTDGSFDGLIVASFMAAEPRRVFRTANVGQHGAVWLFHREGVVMLQEPSAADPIGTSARDNPIFVAAAARRSGTLRAPVLPGGGEMLSAYHRLDSPPVTVAVSLDRAEVVADLRRLARGSLAVFLVATVLLATTVFILFRQLDQKAAAERALEEQRRLEAERLREANERLEASLESEQRARREAEEANALKDQFVMTVSHELRTPLTAIAGWARMLVDGMVSDDKKDTALRTIERNAQAQRRLIEDLLDVSGIMNGKLRLDVRPVMIADVVRLAVDAIAPAVDAKQLVLQTKIDPNSGIVSGDPERLQQVIWNLLSNAVKFTPSGGRVAIAVTRGADGVEIVVTDTGPGIPPEFLPHVFERFRQGHQGPSRHHGGLGLGLAIVETLVDLHGGSVSAHSDGIGKGATFIVRLPAAAAVAV